MTRTIQTLTDAEYLQLKTAFQEALEQPDLRERQVRNFLMFLLMLDAGLRVGEVVLLRQADLFFNGLAVTSLRVPAIITKTKTARIIPLTPEIRHFIKWLSVIWEKNLHYTEGVFAFFTSSPANHLTVRQVERITRKLTFHVIHRTIHPHGLRHTFATRLMRVTNIRVVQELLGHAKLSSTQVYTHPSTGDLERAIAGIADTASR